MHQFVHNVCAKAHAFGLIAICSLTAPAHAGQNDLLPVEATTLIAKTPVDPNRSYLSTFTWAGGCDDNRVQAWSDTARSPAHKWSLRPVPLANIQATYPSYKDTGAVYYVVSHEKESQGCASKYLSGALGCGGDAQGRRVQLWDKKDEEGVQWWQLNKNLDGSTTLVNVYNMLQCGNTNTFLATDGSSATRVNSEAFKGLNFNWTISGLRTDTAGVSKPKGIWEPVFFGGPPVGTITITESLDIGNLSEDSWSTETRQALAVAIESGVEFGPASGSASVTATSEEAVGKAGSIARSENKGYSITRDIPYDREKYEWGGMYQWIIRASVQGQLVTIKTFDVACTPGNAPPNYLPGSPAHLDDCGILRQTAGSGAAVQQPTAGGASNIAALIAGDYRRSPVENSWHTGRLTQDGSNFRWTNDAGVSWVLALDPEQTRLVSGGDNPYAAQPDPHFYLIKSNGAITGFRFLGEIYGRQ